MLFLQLFINACLASLVHATLQIVSGGSWTASNGQHIQAHGAAITKVGSTYYLIGENKLNGSSFQSVNCYSSANLVEWTYVGQLLTLAASGDLGPSRVVERPKVVYNDATGKFVLYMHIDSSNYGEAKVGVAVGNSVCGSYTYQGSFQPMGYQSRDIGMYKDDDGSAYLLTEDRVNGLRIEKLSSDFLTVESIVYTWAEKYESPAILKRDGVYFMFASKLTGWNANDNLYSTATSLSGPWSAWSTFAPVGTLTHTSQTSFILPVSNSFAMYMGDRWVSSNLMRSTYVWLPLTVSGTTASLPWYYNWIPSVSSGSWSAAPSDTVYEAESATLGGGAQTVTCSGCSGSAVGYIGGTSSGTVTFSNVQSDVTTRTTIRMRYTNGDTTQRFALIEVNGVGQRVAFIPGGSGQETAVVSFTAQLNAGTSNTIRISGVDGGWGPDIDRVFVPTS
ncbi:galactan 1,3-beta-galactosidase [Tricharina praecox]|uniref:galactan 1,3-beta-galactosidase n=1 Tax=Tricharina praecox TaxID=43433 RepID=UPI00221FFF48|nr:galactan 1,3-beta-galactosidase [Tricharina praecox]KAI5854710.1 galactan 1,3-beta-galactosidase [Tricharina praecox]